MYDSPVAQEVVFFLCCSDEDCTRFTAQIRDLMLHNEVRSVADPRRLIYEIEHLPSEKGPVLIVLDVEVDHAWEGYDALKASPLRFVPVVAICGEDEAETAYARGVNAVVPKDRWAASFTETVVHLTSFWVRLVRLPRPDARIRR